MNQFTLACPWINLHTRAAIRFAPARVGRIRPPFLSSWTDGPRVGGPAAASGSGDPACPAAALCDGSGSGTLSCSGAQTRAAPEAPPALTGGAQHALSAAINLHHGGFESERGVCDRRYVSGNEV